MTQTAAETIGWRGADGIERSEANLYANGQGITSGCGGNRFCPGAPLTRGQMSVFLAKALGLHWPN